MAKISIPICATIIAVFLGFMASDRVERIDSLLCSFLQLILHLLLPLVRAQLSWKKELPIEMFEETSYEAEYEFNFPHTQYDVVR